MVNAVLGFAGLPVTLGALAAGKRLALANKESLIAAAPLVANVRATPGRELLPVTPSTARFISASRVRRTARAIPTCVDCCITASGGPFRGWTTERLKGATKDEALRHPTWSMGAKITIDSSTLMNKGLEVMEATALFGIEVDRVEVVVHPQSIVHSMVEYVDGSVLAQLSNPDMRLPIAYCLGAPDRLDHGYGELDFTSPLELTFEPPDRRRLSRARRSPTKRRDCGGAAPAWLSAANEVAVEAFLKDEINWCDIVPVVAATMDHYADKT